MKQITIKKRTLIICATIIAVLAAAFTPLYLKYSEEKNKKKKAIIYFEILENETSKEYESLKRKYDHYVEIINNNNYSLSTRYDYVVKVNQLLEVNKYDVGLYSYVYDFVSKQPKEKYEDYNTLKRRARENIFKDE